MNKGLHVPHLEEFCLGNKLLSAVSDAIISVDLHLTVTYWNEAAERIYGWTEHETLGKNFVNFFVPETLEAIFEGGFHALTAEGAWNYEVQQYRKSGEALYVQCSVNALRDEHGVLAGFVTINRDVTAFRRAEAFIRLQAKALNAAANAIMIADRDGKVEYVNHSFTELSGFSASEIIGQHYLDVARSGLHSADFYNTIGTTLSNGKVWSGELISRRKDNSLYHEELTITPVKDNNNTITNFIAIRQNITRRKQAETELLRQNDVLKNIAWLQAHKVRAPVATILGLVQVFNRQNVGDEFNGEVLDNIEKVAHQLDEVIREIVSRSQFRTTHPECTLETFLSRPIPEALRVQ